MPSIAAIAFGARARWIAPATSCTSALSARSDCDVTVAVPET